MAVCVTSVGAWRACRGGFGVVRTGGCVVGLKPGWSFAVERC
ncbi:hypothetical protein M3J09_012731 [Ascochyta lentis]